ncbi:MAG: hypothetical protein ACI8YQ_000951 [Polaribacter sp.]|jgi:hypothetical protein
MESFNRLITSGELFISSTNSNYKHVKEITCIGIGSGCIYRRIFNVLRVMNRHEDFLHLAAANEIVRTLQSFNLINR